MRYSRVPTLFCGALGLPLLWPRHNRHPAVRRAMCICCIGLAALATLASVGCGKSSAGKSFHGSVACDGKPVPLGQVSFVPLDPSIPIRTAPIIDGQYRIVAPGGVPFGKYRVEVDAKQTTGRKVSRHNGREMAMVDETVRVGQAVYAGAQSPLSVDVHADTNDTYDITIR
jgi:hypothetical protein